MRDIASEADHFPLNEPLTETQAHLIKGLLYGYSIRARSLLNNLKEEIELNDP